MLKKTLLITACAAFVGCSSSDKAGEAEQNQSAPTEQQAMSHETSMENGGEQAMHSPQFNQSADLADSDNDGVINQRDKCADTPEGTEVEGDGCPKWETITEVNEVVIFFEIGSSTVNSQFMDGLTKISDYSKTHPEATVIIEGFTSDIGSKETNERLRRERALAAKEVLITQGVLLSAITIHEQGKASNVVEQHHDVAHHANQRVYVRVVRLQDSMQKKWNLFGDEETKE